MHSSPFFLVLTCIAAIVQCIGGLALDKESLEKLKNAYNKLMPAERQIRRFVDVNVDSDDSWLLVASTINATILTDLGGKHFNIELVASELAETGFKRELALASGAFDSEYFMLTEVLPRMNELALEFADTSEKLFPELLEVKAGSHWIKLNSAHGLWEKGGRQHATTYDEVALVTRSLAKWHAMSAVIIERGLDTSGYLKEGLTMRNKKRTLPFYRALLENFAELVGVTWGPEWSTIASQSTELATVVGQKIIEIYQSPGIGLKVINHGDIFLGNMIFCHGISDTLTTPSPIALKFAHFPTSFAGSPALDVNNLLYTLPSVKTVLHHRTRLLRQEYYPSLVSYLGKFRYRGAVPTLTELEDELSRTELIGVLGSINFFKDYVFEKNDPAKPDVFDLVETSWKTGVLKVNMTGMLKNQFSDVIKTVMVRVLEGDIFGKHLTKKVSTIKT